MPYASVLDFAFRFRCFGDFFMGGGGLTSIAVGSCTAGPMIDMTVGFSVHSLLAMVSGMTASRSTPNVTGIPIHGMFRRNGTRFPV
jgi:Ca2+/Na+ antiporter